MIKSRRFHNALLSTSILIFIFATCCVIWWQKSNITPALPAVSSHEIPSPNAYDQYVAAVKAMRDVDKLRYAINDNLRKPLSPHPAMGGRPAITATRDPLDRPWSLAEKETLLHKNAVALRLIRTGLQQDYLYPSVPSRLAAVPFGGTEMLRMEQLIVLDAQIKAKKGDWESAASTCLEGIRFGTTIPRGAPLSTGFISWSCRSRAKKELWKVTDHLSASSIHNIVQQMEQIAALRVPLPDMIQAEKLCGQQTLHEIFQKPNWRGWILENACDFPATRNNLELAAWLVRWEPRHSWRIMTSSKSNALSEYSDVMDEWKRVAGHPYPARLPLPKEPANPFSKIMLTICQDGMIFGDTKAKAEGDLLLTALALRVYRLEHGRYPTQLVDLVPAYLTKVPNDPFALKAPLRYKKSDDHYVLYSIGPDGKDNGGTAVINRRMPIIRNYVDWDGKGDIVVGINVP